MINTFDESTDGLESIPISLCYGMDDLYKDHSNSNPYHIEKAFARLERQAADIIKKIEDELDSSGPKSVTLVQHEIDTLQKFLFLMPIRRRGWEPLPSSSKEAHEFRKEHALKDAREMWLFNMENILRADSLAIPADSRIFIQTRRLFYSQSQYMQMCFYVAPLPCDFLLTEEGFGVGVIDKLYTDYDDWRGRSEAWTYPQALEGGEELYHLPYTYVYAISPKFAILFHSIRSSKNTQFKDGFAYDSPFSILDILLGEGDHSHCRPFFGDLPHSDPKVVGSTQSYTSSHLPQNSQASSVMVASALAQERRERTFQFDIHQLNARQTEEINSLMLEASKGRITYTTREKLLTSVTFYALLSRLPNPDVINDPRKDRLRSKLDTLIGPLPPHTFGAAHWREAYTVAEPYDELESTPNEVQNPFSAETWPEGSELEDTEATYSIWARVAGVALQAGIGLLLGFGIVRGRMR